MHSCGFPLPLLVFCCGVVLPHFLSCNYVFGGLPFLISDLSDPCSGFHVQVWLLLCSLSAFPGRQWLFIDGCVCLLLFCLLGPHPMQVGPRMGVHKMCDQVFALQQKLDTILHHQRGMPILALSLSAAFSLCSLWVTIEDNICIYVSVCVCVCVYCIPLTDYLPSVPHDYGARLPLIW